MDPRNDEQTELLRHIWQEMKALGSNLGARIDAVREEQQKTNARVDRLCEEQQKTNARLDETNVRLGVVEETLQELAAQQVILGRYVRNRTQRAIRELGKRVSRIEDAIALGRR